MKEVGVSWARLGHIRRRKRGIRKVRGPFQRTDRDGWWIEYSDYVDGKRIQHRLKYPTRAAAERGRMETERRINAARYVGMAYPWTQAVSEYLARFDAEGLRDASRYQAQNALRLFAESCFPRTAEDITQWAIDHYTAQRRAAGVSLWTVRKELGVLRTFVNWMAARDLHAESIVWPKIRVEAPVKRALATNEIRRPLVRRRCPPGLGHRLGRRSNRHDQPKDAQDAPATAPAGCPDAPPAGLCRRPGPSG